jgi:hypothetical protein
VLNLSTLANRYFAVFVFSCSDRLLPKIPPYVNLNFSVTHMMSKTQRTTSCGARDIITPEYYDSKTEDPDHSIEEVYIISSENYWRLLARGRKQLDKMIIHMRKSTSNILLSVSEQSRGPAGFAAILKSQ